MIGLHVSAIGVVGNVVQAEDQAIVYVTHPNAGLIELPGVNVVTRRSQQDPIGIKLDLAGSQDALLAIENAKIGLGGVVSAQQSSCPSFEIDPGLELGPLDLESIVIETEPRRERVNAVRLVRH